ncbi:MAG: hypothetical protein JXR69_03670 [Candidatus Delongbacteria bacterium]|nr:hypothetical protein [Candidatus Delongbacteria bacterium]
MSLFGNGNRSGSRRGQGRSAQGQDLGKGGGKGRNNGSALGTGGSCACAKCGAKIPHQQGTPCTQLKCHECGNTLVREELLNK